MTQDEVKTFITDQINSTLNPPVWTEEYLDAARIIFQTAILELASSHHPDGLLPVHSTIAATEDKKGFVITWVYPT